MLQQYLSVFKYPILKKKKQKKEIKKKETKSTFFLFFYRQVADPNFHDFLRNPPIKLCDLGPNFVSPITSFILIRSYPHQNRSKAGDFLFKMVLERVRSDQYEENQGQIIFPGCISFLTKFQFWEKCSLKKKRNESLKKKIFLFFKETKTHQKKRKLKKKGKKNLKKRNENVSKINVFVSFFLKIGYAIGSSVNLSVRPVNVE